MWKNKLNWTALQKQSVGSLFRFAKVTPTNADYVRTITENALELFHTHFESKLQTLLQNNVSLFMSVLIGFFNAATKGHHVHCDSMQELYSVLYKFNTMPVQVLSASCKLGVGEYFLLSGLKTAQPVFAINNISCTQGQLETVAKHSLLRGRVFLVPCPANVPCMQWHAMLHTLFTLNPPFLSQFAAVVNPKLNLALFGLFVFLVLVYKHKAGKVFLKHSLALDQVLYLGRLLQQMHVLPPIKDLSLQVPVQFQRELRGGVTRQLNVVSYNCYTNLLDGLRYLFCSMGETIFIPDVICLQEINHLSKSNIKFSLKNIDSKLGLKFSFVRTNDHTGTLTITKSETTPGLLFKEGPVTGTRSGAGKRKFPDLHYPENFTEVTYKAYFAQQNTFLRTVGGPYDKNLCTLVKVQPGLHLQEVYYLSIKRKFACDKQQLATQLRNYLQIQDANFTTGTIVRTNKQFHRRDTFTIPPLTNFLYTKLPTSSLFPRLSESSLSQTVANDNLLNVLQHPESQSLYNTSDTKDAIEQFLKYSVNTRPTISCYQNILNYCFPQNIEEEAVAEQRPFVIASTTSTPFQVVDHLYIRGGVLVTVIEVDGRSVIIGSIHNIFQSQLRVLETYMNYFDKHSPGVPYILLGDMNVNLKSSNLPRVEIDRLISLQKRASICHTGTPTINSRDAELDWGLLKNDSGIQCKATGIKVNASQELFCRTKRRIAKKGRWTPTLENVDPNTNIPSSFSSSSESSESSQKSESSESSQKSESSESSQKSESSDGLKSSQSSSDNDNDSLLKSAAPEGAAGAAPDVVDIEELQEEQEATSKKGRDHWAIHYTLTLPPLDAAGPLEGAAPGPSSFTAIESKSVY